MMDRRRLCRRAEIVMNVKQLQISETEIYVMRRVICLVLAVVLCMALACPALAATKNSPEKIPGCDHSYNALGVCKYCGAWRDNPKTGDDIMAWSGMMVLSLGALAGAAVIYRKKFA